MISMQCKAVLFLAGMLQIAHAFVPGSLPITQTRARAMAMRPAMALQAPAAALSAKVAVAAPIAAAQASILVRLRKRHE